MKTIRIIFLILCFCCLLKDINAQSVSKKDTIYYLVDLNKIPINDRMITVDSESVFKLYTINCRCSILNKQPVFFVKRNNAISVKKKELAKVKFITLAFLIDLIKTYDYVEFNKKYVCYFVEPMHNKYLKNRVMSSVPDSGTTYN